VPDNSNRVPVTTRLAAGVGGLLAANGVLFFVAPETGLQLFGLPGQSPGLLPPLLGIREIAFGTAVLILSHFGHVRALAAFLLLGAVVPVVDAVVVIRETGAAAALPHLAAIPVCLGLGLKLWWVSRGPADGPGSR
jgi:hypothetical protein